MPVFEYTGYRNPYGPSIAEALGHQGDVQANLALQQGAIAAQAARDRGTMWGNILGTVGETAVAIPQHRLQAQKQALADQEARQRMQITGYQLDAAQREQQSRAAFDEVVKDPANYNADGSPNHGLILQGLRQRSPAAAMAFEKQLTDAAKAGLDLQKTQAEIRASNATVAEKADKLAENERGVLGDAALNAVTALSPDQPLQMRDLANRYVNRLVADKSIPPERANQFYLDMAKAGPMEVEPLLRGLVPPQKQAEYEQKLAAVRQAAAAASRPIVINGQMFDPTTHEPIGLAAPPQVKPGEGQHVINGQLVGPTGERIGAPVPKQVDPTTAGDVTALSPAGLDAAALNYAKTGLLPPLGMGDKTTRKQIINRAAEMMPGLDIASAKADYAANTDSLKTMQKQRDAIGAFEQTAMKNIDIFLDAAGKVVDTGSPLANSLARQVTGKMLGSPDQAAYDAARQVAVNEIAKIVSNPTLSGTLSDSARHEVEAFNPATATLQQSVAVMRLLKRDMGNRTSALDDGIAGIKSRITKGAPAAPGGGVKILSITPVP